MSICFFLLFLQFDGPPLFFQLFFRAFFPLAKDVGMAADHLFIDAVNDLPEGKGIIFGIDFGHEDQEKEHVAQFLTEVFGVVIVDGGNNFGEFLLKIFFQAEGGLFLVPWTAVGAKQGTYGMEQQGKVVFVGGHKMAL